MKVMIVDDSSEIRRLVRDVLAPLQAEFVECADGSEALRKSAESRPDLVLMDLHMEGMDGITTTRLLREARPDCRVIILTQHDGAILRRAAASAGAIDYVLKEDLHSLSSRLQQAASTDRGRQGP
jgi:two-component system response regulator YesN